MPESGKDTVTGPASRSAEKLFEFLRGRDRVLYELRDHGAYGIEAQFFKNEEFVMSRRFDAQMSTGLTPREMAVQWAEQERVALMKAGADHE